ncbi:hypothetical protein ARMSODRAFT_949504 [Armillaria solidipes]|uniref:Heterokaryon incompatibility domain-containing protein n=1 Tax=Armillaria solidipes TaxID=1076256 RepID=A0A2H3CQK7_9AGAR|nr:hypothetical protein ARMSODRAFT_949504 [Armillaria solidipes]
MFLYYARSAWEYVKLKIKIAVYKWMYRKVLRKLREDYLPDRTGWQLPEVISITISSQTEIGQTEESIKVPNQRAYTYTGGKAVISSSDADKSCSSLGIQGLLDLLNATIGTSYTLDTPFLSSVLKDCIAKNYDFGTAYGRLRKTWYDDIQMLREHEVGDINRRRDALDGGRIVKAHMPPRRVWDLYSNRMVPWWSCRLAFHSYYKRPLPISHAWVDEVDRVEVWTPINGYEWPVPIPKGANLDLIRIEMLNLGVEYTWLDVLCLRQRGGPREALRVEEWKLDVPTIGAIYRRAEVVWYLSGLGLPLSLKEGDLESDRSWFRRAWTLQEVGRERTFAGDTPDGPLHTNPIDEAGNYKDEILKKFHKKLESAELIPNSLYGMLSAMQDRISTYPVDKVAGLAFYLRTGTIVPAYYESQSLEDAWTALINQMDPYYRGLLLFIYPEPGTGCKKWRPSWEQVMTKSLPSKYLGWGAGNVERDANADDWCNVFHIESGFVRGLAVGGVEGIDRYGELVVKNADGKAHTFDILVNHQYPIPEDTYALLGSMLPPEGEMIWPQYWVVGRRLPNKMFEKVSVFTMTDFNDIRRLRELHWSLQRSDTSSIPLA